MITSFKKINQLTKIIFTFGESKSTLYQVIVKIDVYYVESKTCKKIV